MFNIPILAVAIGMIFIYLLLSLIVTAAQETLASLTTLRGAFLRQGIKNMLDQAEVALQKKKFRMPKFWRKKQSQADDSLTTRFYSHPIITGFSFDKSNPLPSYIEGSTFVDVLKDILPYANEQTISEGFNTLKQKVDALQQPGLKTILKKFLDRAEIAGRTEEEKLLIFEKKVADWYDNTMERVSGYYKRHIQAIILLIGFLLAFFMNADSLHMFSVLSTDKTIRDKIVGQAVQYVNEHSDSPYSNVSPQSSDTSTLNSGSSGINNPVTSDSSFDKMMRHMSEVMNNSYFRSMNQTIGIGWSEELPAMHFPPQGYPEKNIFSKAGWFLEFFFLNMIHPAWLFSKLLGWLITALAISLGAPFWFDLLKKLVNIRGAGGRPEPTDEKEENKDLQKQQLLQIQQQLQQLQQLQSQSITPKN